VTTQPAKNDTPPDVAQDVQVLPPATVEPQCPATPPPGYTKRFGGASGAGFKPGQSGNPLGGKITHRRKALNAIGEEFRLFLAKPDPEASRQRSMELKRLVKVPRFQALMERLYREDPELFLAYAVGKPVQMQEVQVLEGAPYIFTVRLKSEEIP
jgi:hypothetical protein